MSSIAAVGVAKGSARKLSRGHWDRYVKIPNSQFHPILSCSLPTLLSFLCTDGVASPSCLDPNNVLCVLHCIPPQFPISRHTASQIEQVFFRFAAANRT